MQGLKRPPQHWDGAAIPHGPALKKAIDQTPAFALHHGRSHLRHWVRQPLAVHPLPPQDHGRGDHCRVERNEKHRPPQQRLGPSPIRDFPTLEESAVVLAVVNQDRVLGQERAELFLPLVLRRAVIGKGRENGQQLLAHAHRAQGRDHQEHDVHQDQVGAVEGQRSAVPDQDRIEQHRGHQKGGKPQARFEQVDLRLGQVIRQIETQRYRSRPQRPDPVPRHHLEQDVEQADEHEKQKDRAWGIEIPRHKGRVHGHVGVWRANGEEEAEKDARPKAAPSHADRGPRTRFRGGGKGGGNGPLQTSILHVDVG